MSPSGPTQRDVQQPPTPRRWRSTMMVLLLGVVIGSLAVTILRMVIGLREAPAPMAANVGIVVDDLAFASQSQAPVANQAVGVANGMPNRTDPLPSLDMPLADSIDELERRTAAGDAAAACRLAFELERCSTIDQQRSRYAAFLSHQLSLIDSDDESVATDEDIEDVERITADWQGYLASVVRHCEDIPVVSRPQVVWSLRRAASLGSRPAQRIYANGSSFSSEYTLELLEELVLYRDQAEPMANALAREGDFAMVMALARAYMPESMRSRFHMLSQAVDVDASRSWAMLHWARALLSGQEGEAFIGQNSLVDEQLRLLEREMTPDDLARGQLILETGFSGWKRSDPNRLGNAVTNTHEPDDRRLLCENPS